MGQQGRRSLGKKRPDEILEEVSTTFNTEKRQFLVTTSHRVYAALERAVACKPDSVLNNYQTTLQKQVSLFSFYREGNRL